jgi:Polycystin cation channel
VSRRSVFKANFFEVQAIDNLFPWMQGVMLPGAYPETWYNGDPLLPNTTQNDLLYVARRLGGVQLRQMRVRPDSCSGIQQLGENYVSSDGECFGDFDDGVTDDREPFGPGGKYKWTDGHHNLKGLSGYGPTYGTGGYVTMLPNDRANASAMIQQLYDDKWLDRQTRAVSVMLNVWNMETRFLTIIHILFEVFPSGYLVNSYQFYSLKPALYETSGDGVRAIGEIIIALGCVYYLWFEIKTLVVLRCNMGAYIQRASNAYELMLQIFVLSVLFFYFQYLVAPQRTGFDSRTSDFTDLFSLANDYIFIFTLAAFIGLLQILKLFRYFGIAKRMLSLWYTLQLAFPDLIAFGVGYIMLNVGFAYMAVMLFGGNVDDFHTFAASFSTLLRFPMGGADVSYADLVLVRPEVTPWFFLFFLTLIMLVCFNILVAIIVIFYELVSKNLRRADPWKRGLASPDTRFIATLQTNLRQRCRNCRGCWGLCPQGRGADAEHRQMMAEQRFATLVQEFDDRCWSVNAIDVQDYFEKIFEARGRSHTVYVSRRELAALASPIDTSKRGGMGACARQSCLGCMVTCETVGKFAVGVLTCSVCTCEKELVDDSGQVLPRRNSEVAQRRPSIRSRILETEKQQASLISRQARSQTGMSVEGDADSLVSDLLGAYARCKDVVLMGNVEENDDRLQSNTVLPDGFVVRNSSYIGTTAMEDSMRAAAELRSALVQAGRVVSSSLISTAAFNGDGDESDGDGAKRSMSAAALSAMAAETVTRFVVCRVSSRRAYAVRQLEVDARSISRPMVLVRRPDGQTTHRFPLDRIAQIESSRVDTDRVVLVLVGADEVKTAKKRSQDEDDDDDDDSGRNPEDEEAYGNLEKSLTFRFLPDESDPSRCEREAFIERLLVARVAALGGNEGGGLIMQGMAAQIVTGIVSTLVQRRREASGNLPGVVASNPLRGAAAVEMATTSPNPA